MTENEVATLVVDAAYRVHTALGPGLLESVYVAVLAHEVQKRGLPVLRQVPVQVRYDGLLFEEGFRADIIIADLLIVEVKSTDLGPALRLCAFASTVFLPPSGPRIGEGPPFPGAEPARANRGGRNAERC